MKTMIYSVFALMLSASALTACSDEEFNGDPAKDWNGTHSSLRLMLPALAHSIHQLLAV